MSCIDLRETKYKGSQHLLIFLVSLKEENKVSCNTEFLLPPLGLSIKMWAADHIMLTCSVDFVVNFRLSALTAHPTGLIEEPTMPFHLSFRSKSSGRNYYSPLKQLPYIG